MKKIVLLITQKFFLFAFLALIAIIMVAPFAWMVSSSFKPIGEVLRYPPRWIPEKFTLANYPAVFKEAPFARFFLNSIYVASVVVVGCVFTSSLAGFAFAKYSFRGRDAMFLIVLSTMMIPFQVIVIPWYIIMKFLHWIDTYWALIVPSLNSAFGIYLMRQFITTIPTDMIDAGHVDGCSEFRIYWQIILPLSKPALATLSIFLFMWNWDSFFWPVIIINSTHMRTLPLGLSLFRSEHGTLWHLIMAGTVVSVLPTLIFFLIAQRRLIEGITLTGLKG
ncbi:MAG: carbohydrate ABC transporter permease [bacterium]